MRRMTSDDQAVKPPKPAPGTEVEQLGYIESFDAVIDKKYAYVAFKETKLDKGQWRIMFKSSVTVSTFIDPFHSTFKQAVERAAGHDQERMQWGYELKPKDSDPRQVLLELILEKGKPAAAELRLVTRKADGSAREPEILKVDWPADG